MFLDGFAELVQTSTDLRLLLVEKVRHVIGAVIIFVLAIAFAPADDSNTTTDTAATAARTTPSPAPASAFDRPTTSERAALKKRLLAIEPRFADNIDRYIDRSVNTCQMLQDNGWAESKNVSTTVERFQGGTVPDFSAAQAKRVLSAIRDTFCDA